MKKRRKRLVRATRWQSFCKVVLPELSPALVAGVALSFTRSLVNLAR